MNTELSFRLGLATSQIESQIELLIITWVIASPIKANIANFSTSSLLLRTTDVIGRPGGIGTVFLVFVVVMDFCIFRLGWWPKF